LGLPGVGPVDAFRLASQEKVTVWSISDVPGLAVEDLTHLTQTDGDSWSGVTLKINERHLIVYNSSQSPRRINSVVMHELSHIMLGHELETPHQTSDGMLITANYNREQELEADWFAGTLLLPRPALLWMRNKKMSDEMASSHFGVSMDMLRWRIRMTGIDIQIANFRR
jgi:Zn-dependent peptidase ImmA (M78 family)